MISLKKLVEHAEQGDGFVVFIGVREPKKTTDKDEVQKINFDYLRIGLSTLDLPESIRQFKGFASNDVRDESKRIEMKMNAVVNEKKEES